MPLEPFTPLNFRLGIMNLTPGIWLHGVKWKQGESVLIGTDAGHITIMCNCNGFHHSKYDTNTNIKKYSGDKHTNAVTLELIIDHIEYNKNFYDEDGIKIIKALKYIINYFNTQFASST